MRPSMVVGIAYALAFAFDGCAVIGVADVDGNGCDTVTDAVATLAFN